MSDFDDIDRELRADRERISRNYSRANVDGRAETDLRHAENAIARLTRADMTLEQIERFERMLHRGHTANLLKIDRIIATAKGQLR